MEFVVYLVGFVGCFFMVIDSILFYLLLVDSCDCYLSLVYCVVVLGVSYYVLVFVKGVFFVELEVKLNEVDEDELCVVVSKYWKIDEIWFVFIYVNLVMILF